MEIGLGGRQALARRALAFMPIEIGL